MSRPVKADALAEMEKRKLDFQLDWLSKTSGQNIARRLIALMITVVWLAMYLGALACSIAAIWVDEKYKPGLLEMVENLSKMADQFGGGMMLILGFYFAAPYMGPVATSALRRFGGVDKDKT